MPSSRDSGPSDARSAETFCPRVGLTSEVGDISRLSLELAPRPSLPVSSLRALSVGTSFLQVQGIKAPPCGPDTIQAHLVFSPDLGRDSRMNPII